MAMTAEGLADAIFKEMDSSYDGIGNGEKETKEYLSVFAKGIVEYLKANMEVSPGSLANSAGSLTGSGKVS